MLIRDAFKTEFGTRRARGEKFSVTLDEWSSTGNRRYLNINLHLCGQSWNLGLVRIKGKFTAELCQETIIGRLEEFGLSFTDDITCLITDGAAMMKKLGRISGKQQQLCFSHGIHLAVTDVVYKVEETQNEVQEDEPTYATHDEDDDFESPFIIEEESEPCLAIEFEAIIKKVRSVVKVFTMSPKNTEVLHRYTKEAFNKEISLKLDVKTRWNSMYDMLERFQLLKNEVQKALIDLKLSVQFDDCEINVINDLVEALGPVKSAVKSICCHDSNLITCDIALNFMFEKLAPLESTFGQKLYSSLKARIRERRTVMSDVLGYLHHAHSLSQTSLATLCSTLARNQLLNQLKYFARIASQDTVVTEGDVNSPPFCLGLVSNDSVSVSLDEQLHTHIKTVMNYSRARSMAETTNATLTKTIKQEMGLFECGGNRGKVLEDIYRYLITIQPSSVQSERVFSIAGGFCSKVRSKLSDDSLNALVFLKSYFTKEKSI